MIFVFGSNLAGYHAGGAAKEAFDNFDAQWHVGEGPTGRAYALPTMDRNLKPLSLAEVAEQIENFIAYASDRTEKEFFVTAIGCGIAGFTPEEIAPLFATAPKNCTLHRRLMEAGK